jgi:hypothetical protein
MCVCVCERASVCISLHCRVCAVDYLSVAFVFAFVFVLLTWIACLPVGTSPWCIEKGIREATKSRQQTADRRQQQRADRRQQTADSRQETADSRPQTAAESRPQTADSRQQTGDSRHQTAPVIASLLWPRPTSPSADHLSCSVASRLYLVCIVFVSYLYLSCILVATQALVKFCCG